VQAELGEAQMTEDPTRAVPRGPQAASHGSLGPADPTADPATNPALMPVPVPAPGQPGETPTVPTPSIPPGAIDPRSREPEYKRTRSGVLWVGVILSAVVLIFLLIFILQNNRSVQVNFLTVSGTLPIGVALLFAAVAGLLLGAIPGGMRILQLRRAAGRSARSHR
jgi:uncharacterized integral membrane protein